MKPDTFPVNTTRAANSFPELCQLCLTAKAPESLTAILPLKNGGNGRGSAFPIGWNGNFSGPNWCQLQGGKNPGFPPEPILWHGDGIQPTNPSRILNGYFEWQIITFYHILNWVTMYQSKRIQYNELHLDDWLVFCHSNMINSNVSWASSPTCSVSTSQKRAVEKKETCCSSQIGWLTQ